MNDPGYKQLGAYPSFICSVINADTRYNASYTLNATAFSAATVLAQVQQTALTTIYSSCAPAFKPCCMCKLSAALYARCSTRTRATTSCTLNATAVSAATVLAQVQQTALTTIYSSCALCLSTVS